MKRSNSSSLHSPRRFLSPRWRTATSRPFDVSEDLSRFVYDEAPRFDDDMPAYGNAFITQGYVYPAGTLDGGVEGTLQDGTSASPDRVIGTWTCDGYYVADGFRTTTGTIVVTRQVIVFEDGDL